MRLPIKAKVMAMKNLEKRELGSHNKVRALFAENRVRFARAEQLCLIRSQVGVIRTDFHLRNLQNNLPSMPLQGLTGSSHLPHLDVQAVQVVIMASIVPPSALHLHRTMWAPMVVVPISSTEHHARLICHCITFKRTDSTLQLSLFTKA